MIIPIIFSININMSENDLLLEAYFIKALSFLNKFNWPIIAQEKYFIKIEEYPQYLYNILIKLYYDYEYNKEENYKNIKKILIPRDIEERFIKCYPSTNDAYLASLKCDWIELEEYLINEINRVEKEKNEKIEALTSLSYSKFIDNIAKKLNIPVIYYELGPFRNPYYSYKNMYFNFNGILKNSKLEERYNNFCNLNYNNKVITFSKKEICAMFMNREYLFKALKNNINPDYECGLALRGIGLGNDKLGNMIDDYELYVKSKRKFGENNMIVRNHPNISIDYKLNAFSDNSLDLIDFIKMSKRIINAASNVALEASLLNKPVYTLGFSQYTWATNSSLENLDDKIMSDNILNFIIFAYLIPMEFFNNIEYIRWRLTNPSDLELYNYHLKYYLNCMKINEKILNIPKGKRLPYILKARRINNIMNVKQIEDMYDDKIYYKENSIEMLNVKLARRNIELEEMDKKLKQLQNAQNELNSIKKSKSYKIMEPLRKVREIQLLLKKEKKL